MKRWQLLVYFQLRFREIVKDVEDVLGDKKESLSMKVASSNEGKRKYNQNNVTYICIL